MKELINMLPTKVVFCVLLILGISTLATLTVFGENAVEPKFFEKDATEIKNQKLYATISVVETKNGTSLITVSHPAVEVDGMIPEVSLKSKVADTVPFVFLTQLSIPDSSGLSSYYIVKIYELMTTEKTKFRVTAEDFNQEGFILIGPSY
jgi:hypothetical protein